jgi:hypothetical protein
MFCAFAETAKVNVKIKSSFLVIFICLIILRI